LDIFNKYGIKILNNTSANSLDPYLKGKQGTLRKVTVKVWGTGRPLREFMYSLDMAEACVFVMGNVDINNILELNKSVIQSDHHSPHFINIGTGEEISIKELALKIKKLTGFKGEIVFDESIPDGTMRKITDVSLLNKLGFSHKLDLNAGLAETYTNYLR
jgi:GDP-L-fucose synthase